MLHQTLIPSSASSSSPFFLHANNAATAPPAPAPCPPSQRGSAMPSYANHHGLLDGKMDTMKTCGFLEEETAEEAAAAHMAMVEREGFSVEDLLDLEEFGGPEKDCADHDDAPPSPAPAAAAEDTEKEKSPDDSQPLSTVTYPLPAPPQPEMVDLPAHDVEEELEWVSRIMDDSFSELPPQQPQAAMMAASQASRPPLAHRRPYDGEYRAVPQAPGQQRTPTVCALSTEALVPVKAPRSKRSRSSSWSLSAGSLFSDSASSSSTATTSSCSSSGGSFSPFFLMEPPPLFGHPSDIEGYRHLLPPPRKKSKHGKPKKPKKRGRKPKHNPQQLSGAAAASASLGERRCSHCGVQKTPQWRAGPEGAKTLCNACGVRYKSGRLLPEYRPACSPTFVSTIHSNSHRKVLEMRRKKEAGLLGLAAPAVASF